MKFGKPAENQLQPSDSQPCNLTRMLSVRKRMESTLLDPPTFYGWTPKIPHQDPRLRAYTDRLKSF